MKVLLVEDDRQLAVGLKEALQQQDYAVDWVSDGARAERWLDTEHFDLVVLDLTLPNRDGITILKHVRERGNQVPILILTVRGEVAERVTGLNLGADDYLTKPFALSELEARLRALLRRSQGHGETRLVLGPLIFDTVSRTVTLHGELLELPRRELCLLEILLYHAGQVVSREQIADRLYCFDNSVGINAIEVYIHRLRKKFEPAGIRIRTVRGLGYLLER